MDPRYKSRFNDAILAEAMHRFGIASGNIHLLDGFESFLYKYSRNEAQYVLRIGHAARRTEWMVRGEAEWINYLHAGGAGVARAVPSLDGSLVVTLDDGYGEQFLAVAFEHAPGSPPRRAAMTPALYDSWGALLGRMHALSVNYQPVYPRPQWDDPIILDTGSLLPPTEAGALERFYELRALLDLLPRDNPAEYGMIHQDAHAGNFFVLFPEYGIPEDTAPVITLFDFDDCCYSWYANDIAIVLFYAAMGWPDPVGFTRTFLTHFLRGYQQYKTIQPAWLEQIPHFLKLREIDLYGVIHRSFDVNNLTDPWVAGYMRGRKERIEKGAPYLDFDFSQFARQYG